MPDNETLAALSEGSVARLKDNPSVVGRVIEVEGGSISIEHLTTETVTRTPGSFEVATEDDLRQSVPEWAEDILSPSSVAPTAGTVEPFGWFHRIREPGYDSWIEMFSHTSDNPWGRWRDEHLKTCEYERAPVYSAAALAASEAKLAETANGIVLAHGCNVLIFEETRERAETAEARLAEAVKERDEARSSLEILRRTIDHAMSSEASLRPAENAGETGDALRWLAAALNEPKFNWNPESAKQAELALQAARKAGRSAENAGGDLIAARALNKRVLDARDNDTLPGETRELLFEVATWIACNAGRPAEVGDADERMLWFMRILNACGGNADASEYTGNWISFFCDDRGTDCDTFNLAIDRGLTQSSHDTSFDTSSVWITDKGREWLEAALSTQSVAPVEGGWQPIETAPKDGKPLDLWVKPHDAFENGNASRIPDVMFREGEWKRRLVDGYLSKVSHCGTPTHWRRDAPPTEPAPAGTKSPCGVCDGTGRSFNAIECCWEANCLACGRHAPAGTSSEGGELEREILALRKIIDDAFGALGPDCRFMDPPDGGSPSLADQINNMRCQLEEAEHRPWLFTQAAADILAERRRQVEAEGWTPEHDDAHTTGEMADAAACYALGTERVQGFKLWPWHWSWWKPTDRRRDLVKAGALILAEIERLDRAAAPAGTSSEERADDAVLSDERDILRLLSGGESIAYSQDGDDAWLVPSKRSLADAAVISLREQGFIENEAYDEDQHARFGPGDVISPKGRAFLRRLAPSAKDGGSTP